MLTLKSQAETAQIAAANAVMLTHDTAQNVLLKWQEKEILVFPEDTTGEVIRLMSMPGCDVW